MLSQPVTGESISSHPVGAVLVVGGGIAGMQAALDLGDQGFKVYLVEKESAIGGKMAQLDKTFPTNDCAMCTISPKLVEVGRHPNIEILTNAEVLEVNGAAGNFRARIRSEPRYVDPLKCVACGDCSEACPVVIPNRFNENLNTQTAIAKLYPQAVPNAFSIAKRGIAPCRDACPAGQRAQGYIALIREGRWEDALRVIKMDNPFPGICGRICNHRCETACNRGLVDEAINIRALKRYVTDKVYANPRTEVAVVPRQHTERVAIIGAGPCGLTAAQDLASSGYPVTIFEAMPVAGGMLRLGVPEYRLPAEVIEREVQDILDLGVDLRLNHRVDNLDKIFAEGFDAVLIAVGAHEGIRLPIPGADLDGVLVNTHFLRDVRLGRYENGELAPLGARVMILGGGNVAIDCARTVVRLGKEAHVACLETRAEMPAHPSEVEAALAEGVKFHWGRTFEEILSDAQGRVSGMLCERVERFAFDETGRLQVDKIPDSKHTLPCETVIFSIGQRAGLAFIPDDAGVGVTERHTIAVNPNTLAATRPGVFAAGDSVSGTAYVIEAVASGHKAAQSILRYLGGERLEPVHKPPLPVVNLTPREIEARILRGEIRQQTRVPMPELAVRERVSGFSEVERGYDDQSAQAEAARCLACGVCSECMSCLFACGVEAIDHDMLAQERSLEVGAVILAPGYEIYQAELSAEYGFGRFPNVITALQLERMLSASGPTGGHVHRRSDDHLPERIAFLQCVGSRDRDHDYCSAVCCMYATKEAVMTKEHHPEIEVQVFMMDARAFSKGYWEYFERARAQYGVKYTRCRISAVFEDPQTRDLMLHYQDETGQLRRERFGMVVLSVGMQISDSVRSLGRRLGVELDEHGFCHTVRFNPLETSRAGVYAIGPFREPKDIPESVVEASGAAAAAACQIYPARFQLTHRREYPPERDVSGEEPRIGVFVCHCGSNIGGFLDVPAVTAYAGQLAGVAHAEANLYTCSQDSIRHITEQIQALGLNRLVVASCTPLTHQPLFQDSLRAAGLNPFLFEMANIRNQCSWVHSHDREAATQKAMDLVRMAVARAANLEALHTLEVPVQPQALVIGGGPAGMEAALSLAAQGFPVHIVEQEAELGGNLRRLHAPMPQSARAGGLKYDPQTVLSRLKDQVYAHPLIHLHLNSQVVATRGFRGNFNTTVRQQGGAEETISHGVTILATGGREYRGPENGYGNHPQVVTQQEFDALLSGEKSGYSSPKSVVMIQCAGQHVDYCSRICCTTALKHALAVKERNPAAEVLILFKDLRVYGFKERLYTEARRQGVLFSRYTEDSPPAIVEEQPLTLEVWDPTLGRTLQLLPDLLVLSTPIIPDPSAHGIATLFKVPVDQNGFFMEAHVKLRPLDFAKDGIFMAGMAHYPKLLDETLVQAQGAAARAARVLSQRALQAGGQVAVVTDTLCTGCLTCVRACPFDVPKIQPDRLAAGGIRGAAYIEPSVCQGCGICAAECPARAIELRHFNPAQMMAKVGSLIPARDLLITGW